MSLAPANDFPEDKNNCLAKSLKFIQLPIVKLNINVTKVSVK